MEYKFKVWLRSVWSEPMRKRRANRPAVSLRLGDLRLAWLQTFLAVVRLKNRSLAAEELGLTQGAVTKQIQSLENWSRMVLLWPERPVTLTPQGEAFVAVAEQAIQLLAGARPPMPSEQAEPPKAKVSAADLRVPPSVPTPPAPSAINEGHE